MFSLADNNQGKQTDPQPTPGQEQAGAATAPAYITQEQLKAALAEQQAEFEKRTANLYRGMESLTSKAKTRLADLDNTLKQLQSAGQAIDPGAVQKVKTDILAGAFSEEAPQAQTAAAPSGQVAPAAPANPIEQRIQAFQEAFGLELFDEDPEVNGIRNIAEVGEKEFFNDVRQALLKKQQRLASETPERAAARSPLIGASGAPSSNPIANVTNPSELWEIAMNKRGKRTP